MVLTFEYIKECKDKNRIYQEAIKQIRDWAAGVEKVSSGGESSRELEELEERYRKAINSIDDRIEEVIRADEKKGTELLAELQKKKEQLAKERKHSLKTALENSEIAIAEKEERIRFLKQQVKNMASLLERRKREETERQIGQLEREIKEQQQSALTTAEKYEQKLKRLEEEEAEIRKRYFVTKEDREILKQEALQKRKEQYEEKKRQILQGAAHGAASRKWDGNLEQLLQNVIPENMKKLDHALSSFVLNGEVVREKKGNVQYVVTGQVREKLPVMPEEVTERLRKIFPFMIQGDKFVYPYSVSRYSRWTMPGLFYHSLRKAQAGEHRKALLTAFCVSRHPQAVQIYCEESLAKEGLLPKEYEGCNPGLLCSVDAEKRKSLLQAFYEDCRKREAYFAKEGYSCAWEYNQNHSEKVVYRVLIWNEEGIEEEEELKKLQYLLSQGSRYGIEILLFQSKIKLAEYREKQIIETSRIWIQQDDGRYKNAVDEESNLELKPIEEALWTTVQAQNYIHPFESKLEIKESWDELFSLIKEERKNLHICGKEYAKREEILTKILTQLLAENLDEVFYFNFMENHQDYNYDMARSLGMANANRLHYISPDMLQKGLQVLKDTMESSAKKLCVIGSGMEYANDYRGYGEAEKETIQRLGKEVMERWRMEDVLLLLSDTLEHGSRYGDAGRFYSISEEMWSR